MNIVFDGANKALTYAAALAVGAWTFACCSAPSRPSTHTSALGHGKATGAVVPLSIFRRSLRTLDVEVGGRHHRFLFDSGMEVTAVTPDLAKRIGCTPRGRITDFRMDGQRVNLQKCEGVTLTIGGHGFHHKVVGVRNLPKTIPWSESGIVGLQTFEQGAITLNFADNQLIIETDDSLRRQIVGAKPIVIRSSRQAGRMGGVDVEIAAQSPKGRLWLFFSTKCAGTDFVLTPHAALALGLNLQAEDVVHYDSIDVWEVPSAEIDLVGIGPVRGRAVVDKIIYDGVICARVIKRWVVTLDLKRMRGWVKPRGDRPQDDQ